MSGSESQQGKVELTHVHSKNAKTIVNTLHITMKPVFVPMKICFMAVIFVS